MSSDTTIITIWQVVVAVGQWSLLVLLFTFLFVKHLSQRRNPFLINLLLTTFLGIIPPSILLYSPFARSSLPDTLCFVQAALLDGTSPMLGAAQLALVIDTWSVIRSFAPQKRHITRSTPLGYTLIIFPYVIMCTWVVVSFIAATQSKATHEPGFVLCINSSVPSSVVRECVKVFMLVLGMIELIFEACAGFLLRRSLCLEHKDSVAWKRCLHFSLRLTALTFLQLIPIILSVAGTVLHSNSLKGVYEAFTSINALATFLVFGTQRTILQAWKIFRKPEPEFELAHGPFPSYPMDKDSKQQVEMSEEGLDPTVVDIHLKPWLRAGGYNKEPLSLLPS